MLFCFPAVFIFYGLYEGFSGKSIRLPFSGKVLAEFSAATFGMFLIETHTEFSEQIFDFVASWFPHSAGPYLCSLLSIVLQLLLYFLAIFALRKIHQSERYCNNISCEAEKEAAAFR